MSPAKRIALVAHDRKKAELLRWAKKNKTLLQAHDLFATGSTGALLEKELTIKVHKLESGPLGGDLQIGAKIVDGEIDVLLFLWDPLEAQPHDPDVRALLRIAAVWNIPVACNEITADIIIAADFMRQPNNRIVPDYSEYRNRVIKS